MPPLWMKINYVIATLAVIAAFVVSLATPGFTVFLGFSISLWLLAGMMFVYGAGRVALDVYRGHTFFSAWVFPVYTYDAKKQDVIKNNEPAAALMASMILMIFWAALATAWITPVHVGVAVSIVIELLLLLIVIFLIQVSQLHMNHMLPSIDAKIIRRAWIEAKGTYVSNRGAVNRDELVTYEEQTTRLNMFRNKVRMVEGRATLNIEEKVESVTLVQVQDSDFQGWLAPDQIDFTKDVACYSYLFQLEKDVDRTYEAEIELIIMFHQLLITYAQFYKDQKMKFLFTFLVERRPLLLANDIVINIPANVALKI